MERVRYYIDLLITLCGFDGSENNFFLGAAAVLLASLIVIYAFYQCISKLLWPGENHSTHIKRRVLDEMATDLLPHQGTDHAH